MKRVPPKEPVGEDSGPLARPSVVANVFRKRQEAKYRKKDPKSTENVQKNLAGVDDAHKVSYLLAQHKALYNEYRDMYRETQQMTRMKDDALHLQYGAEEDLRRCAIQRTSLQGACRLLQQQNRELREEYAATKKLDEEHLKKSNEKFKEAMGKICQEVDEHRQVNEVLSNENISIRKKLNELFDAFKDKNLELGTRNDQLDLERQRSDAIQQKSELELRAQREINSREMAMVKRNLEKSEANCTVLLDTVKRLQEHLDVYRNQYEGFENTMTESAQVVDKYKHELEGLSKQLHSLRQKSETYKTKYYDTMKALIDMTEVKRKQDLYLQSLGKKNDQLEKLCRQLQKDRIAYLKSLQEHGLVPVIPEEDEAEAIQQQQQDELQRQQEGQQRREPEVRSQTPKEKELQVLKEHLKAVQEQFSTLSISEATTSQSSENVDDNSNTRNPESSPNKAATGTSREVTVGDTPEGSSLNRERARSTEEQSSNDVIVDNDKSVTEKVENSITEPK